MSARLVARRGATSASARRSSDATVPDARTRSETAPQTAENESAVAPPSLLGLFFPPRNAGPKTASKAHRRNLLHLSRDRPWKMSRAATRQRPIDSLEHVPPSSAPHRRSLVGNGSYRAPTAPFIDIVHKNRERTRSLCRLGNCRRQLERRTGTAAQVSSGAAQESCEHQRFADTNPVVSVGLVLAAEGASPGEGFSAVPDLHQTDALSRGHHTPSGEKPAGMPTVVPSPSAGSPRN